MNQAALNDARLRKTLFKPILTGSYPAKYVMIIGKINWLSLNHLLSHSETFNMKMEKLVSEN
jgi:hypothetical protein